MKEIRIQHHPSLPSTNDALKALAADGEEEGLLLIADSQTAGKGRLQRRFFSPAGSGLYMSLLLRPSFSPALAPHVTLAAAVAVAEAVEAVAPVQAKIKWVNDLYIGEKKAGGILTESALSADGGLSYVILGIGVNIFPPTNSFPPDLPHATALFQDEKSKDILTKKRIRDRLAEEICRRFAPYYDTLSQRTYLAAYRARCFLLGRTVWVHAAERDTAKTGEGREAQVCSVTENGGLLVRFPDGKEETLLAGEVTLGLR